MENCRPLTEGRPGKYGGLEVAADRLPEERQGLRRTRLRCRACALDRAQTSRQHRADRRFVFVTSTPPSAAMSRKETTHLISAQCACSRRRCLPLPDRRSHEHPVGARFRDCVAAQPTGARRAVSSQLFERPVDHAHRDRLAAALGLLKDLDGDRTTKKPMIAVLAVTGSRLPSADPEACLRQIARSH